MFVNRGSEIYYPLGICKTERKLLCIQNYFPKFKEQNF